MTDAPAVPSQRRRGAELEAALLDAAWDELIEIGFSKLTMESVAARASTGIAVLYRRWGNKDELVLAAMEYYRSSHLVDVPNTGSLRGDLLEALTGMGHERAAYFVVTVTSAVSGLLAGTGLTPAQVRERILGDQPATRARIMYERAAARGEIDLEHVPAAVLTMPFDLVRHDLLMELKPLALARIASIVDDLFLPLVRTSYPTSAVE